MIRYKSLLFVLLCILSASLAIGQSSAPPDYDVAPEPPGGMEGYLKFLKDNIKYPQIAIDAEACGAIWVAITVDKDGTLSDIHVVKDEVGYGCANEAIRVIKKMPPWKPGYKDGVPIKVKYTIPVRFILTWGRDGVGRMASDQDTFYDEKCNAEPVYTYYNVAPGPKGGLKAYNKFINKHLIYPVGAMEAKASGTVYVYVVVCKDGTISNVKVEEDSVGHGCGEEAVRIIKMMPHWKPARFEGKL